MPNIYGEFAHIPDADALQRYNQMLRIMRKPLELYPDPQGGLTPDDYKPRDKQALLTIGALRQRAAFETLDDWLRFEHRQGAELEKHHDSESHAPVTVILAAGRHMRRRREVILSEAIKPEAAARWEQLFVDRPVFKAARDDQMRGRFGTKYDKARVDLARLSIFSEMYFNRTSGLA